MTSDPIRRHQRIAAYAVLTRTTADGTRELLLTRISARGHHVGAWTLPGGGVDHGENPRSALVRELREETSLEVVPGDLLDVHDSHFTGRAPDGATEDYHGIHLIFAATIAPGAGNDAVMPGQPTVTEVDGTTDAVAWIAIDEVADGTRTVLDVVRFVIERCLPVLDPGSAV